MPGITHEENELLTRTGPGTPMGKLFRQNWLPALLSARLPEPDGPPIAVKLLGERLVAFRDTTGQVGLLGEFCPHRRVSLVFGRNEECGLRCVYHGWKFDTAGRVIETPAERNADFGKSVRHVAYPTWEAGGIIWTYMGPDAEPPRFPEFLFTKLPPEQVIALHYNQQCNYLQGVEGDLDLSHATFLHGTINKAPTDERRAAMAFDWQPHTNVREEWFGLQTISSWKTPDPAKSMIWIHPFIAPCYTIVPNGRTDLRWLWHAWVPIDDENHLLYYVHYDPENVPGPKEWDLLCDVWGHDLIDAGNEWRSRANAGNLHLLDRDRQKRDLYSGIRGIAAQDIAMVDSMGPIVDRTQQYLGSQDLLVVQLRRYLLKLLDGVTSGKAPAGVGGGPAFSGIDSRAITVPKTVTFKEALERREWKWGEITNIDRANAQSS